MADWAAIYDRAEDRHSEMLKQLVAEQERQSLQTSSQDTTGTTTMSQEENRRD